MQVGDLVERSYPSDAGRVGLIVDLVSDDPIVGTKFWLVHWADGVRDTIRSQFLRVVK